MPYSKSLSRLRKIGHVPVVILINGILLLWIFWMPFANGRPLWNSGVLPTTFVALALLLWRLVDGTLRSSFLGFGGMICVSLAAFAVAATISAAINTDGDPVIWINAVSGYLAPVLLFAALLGYPLSERLERLLWASLCLGVLVIFGKALVVYYQSWGIPSAAEFIFSRYDRVRMAPYMEATYGNTSSTAALLVLLTPIFGLLAADRAQGLAQRRLYLLTFVVLMLNNLIVQSRAALLTLIIVYFLCMKSLGYSLTRATVIVLFVLTLSALPFLGVLTELAERFATVLTIDAVADASVRERLEALKLGWNIFLDNPWFGVGPGNSYRFNPYSTAHQFWVQQASELGLLGFLASILLSIFVAFRAVGLIVSSASDRNNQRRFRFVIGPVAYVLFGVLGNMPLNATIVNTWIVLCLALLALSEFREVGNDSISCNAVTSQ